MEMRNLDNIGQSRFKGGISYTFVVFPSGRIYEGHSIGRVGAHTAGRNTISAGICLAGNYETNQVTAEQVAALAWLLNHGIEKGWWTENKLDGGHRDTKATVCPGKHGNGHPHRQKSLGVTNAIYAKVRAEVNRRA
ncbi:hypothetical protein GCM10009715_43610 [Paeniglutamicibacter psychrophenolicus]|uniref:N-acetylmuramoyl-L-alanine amidase domain-containing protein n=1 Tax=Paeniglutamicibacter psychrophenolicus TaxID=257454 RepID=A0ABS4WDX9_9MICC|nr:hypothetical protein [Paeniglutamicibacter psychrophenolicus]